MSDVLPLVGDLARDLLTLAVLGIGAFLIGAFLAPLGVLRWWADGLSVDQGASPQPIDVTVQPREHSGVQHYVVFLGGIGEVSPDTPSADEQALFQELAARLPRLVLVHDVYAFSPANLGLTEEHVLGRFWRWAYSSKLNHTRFRVFGNLINLRNALQVAVAADRRYGPLYSYGAASAMLQSLVHHGYQLGSGAPVTLIGYSGGAQIALGTASLLQPTLEAPIQLISLGGVMRDDPGIAAIEQLYHLYGEHDPIQRSGGVLFPGRWSWRKNTVWNRAVAVGKIKFVNMGPMQHTDEHGYFGEYVDPNDQRSYLTHTCDRICAYVQTFSSKQRDRDSFVQRKE